MTKYAGHFYIKTVAPLLGLLFFAVLIFGCGEDATPTATTAPRATAAPTSAKAHHQHTKGHHRSNGYQSTYGHSHCHTYCARHDGACGPPFEGGYSGSPVRGEP